MGRKEEKVLISNKFMFYQQKARKNLAFFVVLVHCHNISDAEHICVRHARN